MGLGIPTALRANPQGCPAGVAFEVARPNQELFMIRVAKQGLKCNYNGIITVEYGDGST